jgi:hypothetical protein
MWTWWQLKKASDSGNWFQWKQIEHKPALHVKSGLVRCHLNGMGAQFSFLEKVMLPGVGFFKCREESNERNRYSSLGHRHSDGCRGKFKFL